MIIGVYNKRYIILRGDFMNLTKGLPCPRCDSKARFQGGSFGGGINTTNIVCDCGFSAWVIFKKEGFEYQVIAEPEDFEKANPYKGIPEDDLILEKHFLEKLNGKTKNRRISREIEHALYFIRKTLS